MADRKPARGIVRPPFHPRSITMDRRSALGNPLIPRKGIVGRSPQIICPKASLRSHNAVPQTTSRVDDEWEDSDDTDPSHSSSPVRKTKRRSSSPQTPHGISFLPETTQVSPLPRWGTPGASSSTPSLTHTESTISESSLNSNHHGHFPGLPANPAPTRLSWEFARSKISPEQVDRNPSLRHMAWPKGERDVVIDKQISQPASKSKPRQEVGKKDSLEHIRRPSSPPRRPPTPGIKRTKTSREQAEIDPLIRGLRKVKVVYHRGPKGEGQKMWRSIQTMRNERRELKRAQEAMAIKRANAAGAKTQKGQLNALHAAARHMPAISPPIIPPPAPLTPPRKPGRPEERPPYQGPLRSPVAGKPLPKSVQPGPCQGVGTQGTEVSNASTYTTHSFDVPITASQSVQYDSNVSIIPLPIIKLNPAPLPKKELYKNKKKPLPPLPMPPVGEEQPRELQEQAIMIDLRAGIKRPCEKVRPPSSITLGSKTSNISGGRAEAVSKSQSNLAQPVGPESSTAAPPSRSPHNLPGFPSRDHQQTERARRPGPKAKVVPEHSPKQVLFNHTTEYFADWWAGKKVHNKEKQRQELKKQIKAPMPVVAPHGVTANFATEAGGVGGPAAAVAVPPQIRVPIPPAVLKEKEKEKDKKKGTAAWFTAALAAQTAGGPFGRKRSNSDASMVCTSSRRAEENSHVDNVLERCGMATGDRQNVPKHKERPRKPAQGPNHSGQPRRSSFLNNFGGMRVFQGPVEVRGPIKVSPQRPRKPAISDESYRSRTHPNEELVPPPLGGRNTAFYSRYMSLLAEYNRVGRI